LKNTTDECGFTSYATYNAIIKARGLESPKIWEGVKGQHSRPVRELNMEVRPLLDELIVAKATDYIKPAPRAASRSSPTSPSPTFIRRKNRTPTSIRPIQRAWACMRT